ncbi:MAG TPA: HEPN domain-containing protein [Solirubrobacteraceae bacterium]|nr:HEPN domain-containing protein [Solirubrobacteraceae bacterium]
MPDDLIGFHAQQALEKLFKAALAHAGVAPPRIHDLGELLALLGDARLSPPVSATEARALVPWEVEFRYDDILDERRITAAEGTGHLPGGPIEAPGSCGLAGTVAGAGLKLRCAADDENTCAGSCARTPCGRRLPPRAAPRALG